MVPPEPYAGKHLFENIMKSIYIVTQWFPPEHAPIGHMLLELSELLGRNGWNITIITGFPNHPRGVVFDGYRKRLFQEEQVRNIRIWRVYLYTSANRSYFNRILNFLSFTLSSSLCLLLRGKPDLVFAALQPLSVGVVLPIVAKIKRAKLIFNVQDLHPDAQIKLGLLKNKSLIRLLRAVENHGYRSADGLSVICEDFKAHCLARGVDEQRIAVIRNWIDLDEIKPGTRVNAFRSELGLVEEDFVVLFAGTIGLVSGAEMLLDVADSLIDEKDIKIVIVGEGPLLGELKEHAAVRGLGNMVFSPFQPRSRLGEVQAISDVSVVTIKPGSEQMSVPSKVLGYMAAARPVLVVAEPESETARFVLESGAGLVIAPGDPEAIANAIRDLRGGLMHAGDLGRCGREYLEENLSTKEVSRQYNDFFTKILGLGRQQGR